MMFIRIVYVNRYSKNILMVGIKVSFKRNNQLLRPQSNGRLYQISGPRLHQQVPKASFSRLGFRWTLCRRGGQGTAVFDQLLSGQSIEQSGQAGSWASGSAPAPIYPAVSAAVGSAARFFPGPSVPSTAFRGNSRGADGPLVKSWGQEVRPWKHS